MTQTWQQAAIKKQEERRPGFRTFLYITTMESKEFDAEEASILEAQINGFLVVLGQSSDGEVTIGHYR